MHFRYISVIPLLFSSSVLSAPAWPNDIHAKRATIQQVMSGILDSVENGLSTQNTDLNAYEGAFVSGSLKALAQQWPNYPFLIYHNQDGHFCSSAAAYHVHKELFLGGLKVGYSTNGYEVYLITGPTKFTRAGDGGTFNWGTTGPAGSVDRPRENEFDYFGGSTITCT